MHAYTYIWFYWGFEKSDFLKQTYPDIKQDILLELYI